MHYATSGAIHTFCPFSLNSSTDELPDKMGPLSYSWGFKRYHVTSQREELNFRNKFGRSMLFRQGSNYQLLYLRTLSLYLKGHFRPDLWCFLFFRKWLCFSPPILTATHSWLYVVMKCGVWCLVSGRILKLGFHYTYANRALCWNRFDTYDESSKTEGIDLTCFWMLYCSFWCPHSRFDIAPSLHTEQKAPISYNNLAGVKTL